MTRFVGVAAAALVFVWGSPCAGCLWGQAQRPAARAIIVPSTVMAGQLLTKVDPEFPRKAAEQGVTGDVVIEAEVGPDGYIKHAGVLSGPEALQAAALLAVRQWTYKPYDLDGQPVEVKTTVTLRFAAGVPTSGSTDEQVVRTETSSSGPRAAGPSPSEPGIGRNSAESMPVDWLERRPVAFATQDTVSVAKAGEASPPTPAVDASRASAFALPPQTLAMNRAPSGEGPSSGMNGSSAGRSSKPKETSLADIGSNGAKFSAGSARSDGRGMAELAGGAQPGTALLYSKSPVTKGIAPDKVLPAVPEEVTRMGMPAEWRLVRRAEPVYPEAAERDGTEGVVVVQGIIKRDGTLHELRAVSGPAALQQAAIDAAAQYEYAAQGEGRGEARTMVSIDFLLTGPAKLSASWMAGQIEKNVTPDYPPAAQTAGVTGSVTMHVLIGRGGEVKKAEVMSGPAMLRETALESVRQWKYKPQMRNGAHVEVDTMVVVAFTMPLSGVQ